jgi:hypothetical protein
MTTEDNSGVLRHPGNLIICVEVSDVHTASIIMYLPREAYSSETSFISTHIADDGYVSSLIPIFKPQISLRLIRIIDSFGLV